MAPSACRSLIPSIRPKTSNAHSSKPHDLIDSATLLLISLYFHRTADAAFVNFSHVVTSFLQMTNFILKLNNGCQIVFFS